MFKLRYTPTYAFYDDQMVTLFLLLNERGMLQFPTNPRSEEAGKTNNSMLPISSKLETLYK